MSDWTSLAGKFRGSNPGASDDVDDLLSAAARRFGGHARSHFDQSGDVPYAYNESQMHSIMFPTFHDLCELVFREQPMERRARETGDGGGHGQVDYWLERKARTFILEYKHSYLAIRGGKFHAWAQDEWTAGQAQLQTIVEHGGPELLPEGTTAHAVLLMTLWHFRKSSVRPPKSCSKEDSWDSHCELVKQINAHSATSRPVSWHGVWRAPSDMHQLTYGDNHFYVPAVSLIAASTPVVGR